MGITAANARDIGLRSFQNVMIWISGRNEATSCSLLQLHCLREIQHVVINSEVVTDKCK